MATLAKIKKALLRQHRQLRQHFVASGQVGYANLSIFRGRGYGDLAMLSKNVACARPGIGQSRVAGYQAATSGSGSARPCCG